MKKGKGRIVEDRLLYSTMICNPTFFNQHESRNKPLIKKNL